MFTTYLDLTAERFPKFFCLSGANFVVFKLSRVVEEHENQKDFDERIELLYGTIIGQVHYNRQPFYSYVLKTYPSFEAQHLWDSSVVLGHSQNYRRSPY